MSGVRRLDVAVALALVLSVLGCGQASVTRSKEAKRTPPVDVPGSSTHPSVVAQTSGASPNPSTPSPQHEAAAADEMGTFQPRLTLPTEEDPELRCAPRIAGMSGLPNGDLWVAGMCGLRVRVTPFEVLDLRATPKPTRSDGPDSHPCLATAWYDGVLARSATEVYTFGFSSCGTDPNAVWTHPVEQFNGATWTTRGAPLELRPQVLVAGQQGPVYGATLSCTACEEPPYCNILELGPKGLRKLRDCRVPRPGKAGTAERILSAVVDASGVLWVSGYRDSWPNGGNPQHYFLRYENGTWSELSFEDSGTFELDSSGGLWLFGSSAVWTRKENRWQPFEPLARFKPRADAAGADSPAGNNGWLTLAESGAAAPEAIAVRSEHDVWWFGAGREVFHFDGHDVLSVPVAGLGPDAVYFPFSELTFAGPRVYLRSSSRVWELVAPAQAAPVEVRLGSRPIANPVP